MGKKMTANLHFFSKIFAYIKKKQYFCTRYRLGSIGCYRLVA